MMWTRYCTPGQQYDIGGVVDMNVPRNQTSPMGIAIRQRVRANVLLIGCGPHAKRIYLQALAASEWASLKAVVELESKRPQTMATIGKMFNGVEFVFTQQSGNRSDLPEELRHELALIVHRGQINSVIVATEPLSHMSYALWAQSCGLHVLIDKPISTYEDVATPPAQAAKLMADYELLSARRDPAKAFIVNTQRRYHPGFQYVFEEVTAVAREYGVPVTAMQSTHSDGQWRLPAEIVTQDYHPYNSGYGKVSHSGYHILDVMSNFIDRSFSASGKSFDEVGAFAAFITPEGLIHQQNRKDHLAIFGERYGQLNPLTDDELKLRYTGYGEVDASALITLFNSRTPVSNLTVNLLHNSFSRRNWLHPGKDLYKGNGRVKHEYHSIQQGPFQNIQIHSYQAHDKHDGEQPADHREIGGNNHFDVHVFRNAGVLGGEPLRTLSSGDFHFTPAGGGTGLMIEQVKHQVVHEFVSIVRGERAPDTSESDLATHRLSVQLMSLTYQAGATRRELRCAR